MPVRGVKELVVGEEFVFNKDSYEERKRIAEGMMEFYGLQIPEFTYLNDLPEEITEEQIKMMELEILETIVEELVSSNKKPKVN